MITTDPHAEALTGAFALAALIAEGRDGDARAYALTLDRQEMTATLLYAAGIAASAVAKAGGHELRDPGVAVGLRLAYSSPGGPR